MEMLERWQWPWWELKLFESLQLIGHGGAVIILEVYCKQHLVK